MEDFQFQRRGPATALPGKVAAGGRAKPVACYEDVFSGPPRSSPVQARPEDYREIFGAAAACSIPVLDLPPPPGDGYELHQFSALDYLDIFGGFGGGDFASTYQELFASQGSNGIGEALPSELDNATPITGTSNSRELKGMGYEKQEMPASGNITEEPSRDQFGCSLNGVTHHLNDGTSLPNRPIHMSSWSRKSDQVNGTIHKNQAQTIPGFAFVVKNTEIDKPHNQVDINTFFDSNCCKEASEQQHLKKAVLSTSSSADVNYSVSAMKDDQRSTQLEFSGSTIASAYKENAPYSFKNQSSIPRSNVFSTEVSNYQSLHEDFVEKKTEGKCQNKTLLNCMSAGSGNDLKARCTPSEDVPPNEEHLSCSSNDHSASSDTKSSPDCSTDDITIDAGNTRIAEAKHFKSMPGFSPCTSSQNSEDKTAEQKKSNSIPNPPKDVTANEGLHSCSSSSQAISSLDQSCLDGTFLTVSDINLRTQPSQGPPPARPPPGRPSSKFDLSGRNLRRTLTDYQKHDVGTVTTYKSHSFKQGARDGSPPQFDVEVDASSAAAASVAAIKEAMELAQARLKSARVSRERNKDILQCHWKLGLKEDLRSINRDEHETVPENQRIRDEMVVQLTCGKADDQKNVFAAKKKTTAFNPSLPTGDFKKKERNSRSAEVSLQAMHWGEPGVSSVSNIEEDNVGEWKVAEQFYEFIQSEKKLTKALENSMEDPEKRSNTRVGIVEEEQNASELKVREILLAPSKVIEWEGDRWQNLCVTSKEENSGSQEASLESGMPVDCNLKQEETVNAHYQVKQPGEIQELIKSEQKTKWRTSEEGFICELSKKDLRVDNDAFKCKPVYGCQGQEKTQKGTDETFGCEETEKEINVADEYFKDQGDDNIVLGKFSEFDGNKIKASVMYVPNVSGKDVHLKTASKNHEYESHKMSLNIDEYCCFTENQDMELKEASLSFGQDKGNISKLVCQAFKWAENENELKAPLGIPDGKVNKESVNVVRGTNGCSGETKKLMDIQKYPMETEEELHLKAVKQNTSSTAGIKDNFGDDTTAAHEYCKMKINENIKEVQVVDSNKVVKSTKDSCEGTGNVKKIEDARKASSLGEQRHICKLPLESSGNLDAGSPVRNGSQDHETGDVSGNKRDNEQMSELEEEKEREIRKLDEKERETMKLEIQREKKRVELEEANEREGRKLKEEKEREKKLEEEKERERIRLEEVRERERKKLEEEREEKRLEEERKKLEDEEWEKRRLEEEKKKKWLEEERERKKLEEEERERKKLEDEESEKKRLEEERKRKKLEDEEREKRRLEEERERKKLEDEEREKKRLKEEREKRLEEERVMKKLEDEERERKRLEEEKERKKLEDEERERKRLEEEKERKKLEDEEREKKLEEEERRRKKFEDEEREKKRLLEENERRKSEKEDRGRKKSEEAEEKRRLEDEKRKVEEDRERRKLEEQERVRRKREEKERIRKKQEEEDRERSKLEEKERERRKQEEERQRRRLEEIERERRKLEEKVRERRRIEEEERERKLEEEKVRERQKIEEKAREKKLDEEREKDWRKEEEKERERERERGKERGKDRQAVERATREAHERAFAEACERAERAAVEWITAEARQRALAEAQERAEKASAEALEKSMAEKASREARLRSERAAVERATAEARERAVEKAIAEKAAQDARERAEKHATTSRDGVRQNFSNARDFDPQLQNAGSSSSHYQKYPDSNASFTNENLGGSEGESAIRCKARMERHQRTVERAAKALAEKNLRDIIVQREQAERNRLAETLGADVKRWSNGKEGNLRALLSTLQYILGPESGWQSIPLTDVVTAPAVKRAYRKATLCVHPDKLQQRGASIQQKYICEKVFDLLKEAWNKFNSEEW